ncbi:MAG: sigma-54-dependent Fis family transcriptional regulator [Bdellovibrio sp.]|nr:MAG: sigma-54-dependent Fis family transcriptional regulator [Bdellovibrio sp.]
MQRILVVDDETSLRTALFRALDGKGYQVITASNVKEALLLGQTGKKLDLALIDLRLPDGDGIDLMTQLKSYHPHCQVLILTGFGTIELAIKATQKGAAHFVTKPFNLEEILHLVDTLLMQSQLKKENEVLKKALYQKYHFENIIGKSPAITRVLELIERVSSSSSTVLITGESGTGKELVAKAIHFNSPQANNPFVPINCGAIPAELMESELFGHVKGAFTGATQNRIGRFEMADNGTIFLDEIAEMPLSLQVKLLRVLQERKFEPVGSTKTVTCDVRVIAATNKNLEKEVKEGRFREDLYYRLNVIPIEIPSLRERKSDIPLLLHHFIQHFNKTKGQSIKGISQEALKYLMDYSWPGNIRELENLVERLAILKGVGIIDVNDLPSKYKGEQHTSITASDDIFPEEGLDFNSAVDAFENKLILKALEKTGWNRNQAAILLRLNRTTLVEKIKKKGLKPPPDLIPHHRHRSAHT